MKRSTVPIILLTSDNPHRGRPARRLRATRRGAALRIVGLAAAMLLSASVSSLGLTGPQGQVRQFDAVTSAAATVAPGLAVGADGDTPPTAGPPPAESGRVRPVAPAGERRVVVLAASGSTNGIPVSVLTAYRHAAAVLSRSLPDCHLPMTLLAAIGKVESSHARGGRVDSAGNTVQAILGPVLNGGPGMAAIRDTDGGRYDGNTQWDRAVGPMQFIPGTWQRWATDGNADGVANPHNVYDAAMASGRYLCAGGRDLATPDGLNSAIFSYNHSMSYVRLVLAWMDAYASGAAAIPDGTGPAGPSGGGSEDPQAAPTPGNGGPGGPSDPGQPGPGAPGQPGDPAPGQPDPGQPGPGQPGPGQPDPGQPSPGPTDPLLPTPGPDPTPSPGEPTPLPLPGLPSLPPPETSPLPLPTDPLTGVVCTVEGIIDLGGGLIGGLIGQPPPPPEECTTTAPPPPP